MQTLEAPGRREEEQGTNSTQSGARSGAQLYSQALPDLCNMGITMRVLLSVNVAALLLALPGSDGPGGWIWRFLEWAAVVEPAVLLSIGLVCGLRRVLLREKPWVQIAAACVIVACVSVICQVIAALFTKQPASLWNLGAGAAVGAAAAGALIAVFNWRAASRRPALAEARLAALSATIRPHFFFNALNAVLGVVRSDPRTAETMLEDLSELFRTLAKSKSIVTLAEEVDTTRKYLAIESLRLGDRLQVQWHQDPGLDEMTIPQLILQPLIENAVRHGVEPAETPGTVRVKISRKGRDLLIAVDNPFSGRAGVPGLQMALANIRERLMLMYDLEASLSASERSGRYLVVLRLPANRRTNQGSV
jgi:two-component system, LytTR family, sensor histidine kinase AlgZ